VASGVAQAAQAVHQRAPRRAPQRARVPALRTAHAAALCLPAATFRATNTPLVP
jgi:hypothetical protein